MAMFANSVMLLGQPSHFGFGGFAGGMNPTRQAESQNYFDDLRRTLAERAMLNEQRRQARSQQQTTDRELTLKEALANHQMQQDRAASGLAQARLGLDWNTAEADANTRARALAQQGELGWASENRMSRGQDQDEAFRRAQLGQQAQLAMLPYQQRTADSMAQSDFNDRQLAQQKELANTVRPGEMLSHVLGLQELASREAMHDRPGGAATLNARLQQWLNQNPSAAEVMRDARTGQELDQRKRIAAMENATREKLGLAPWTMGPTADNQATLAQRWREFKNRSADSVAADKQREADRDLQRWQHGTESGSAKATRESQREMFDINQLSDDWWRDSQLRQGELDRASREKIAADNAAADRERSLVPILPGMLANPQFRGQAEGFLYKLLGNPTGASQFNPGAHEMRSLFDAQKEEAQNKAIGATANDKDARPKTLADVLKMKSATADTLFDQWLNQSRPLRTGDPRNPGILEDAVLEDAKNQLAPGHIQETLQERLRKWNDQQNAPDPYRPHGTGESENVWAPYFRKWFGKATPPAKFVPAPAVMGF